MPQAMRSSVSACTGLRRVSSRVWRSTLWIWVCPPRQSMRVMRPASAFGSPVGSLVARGEILQAYPYLEEDDLREALSYAAWQRNPSLL